MQDSSKSSALAIELLLSCSKPSKYISLVSTVLSPSLILFGGGNRPTKFVNNHTTTQLSPILGTRN